MDSQIYVGVGIIETHTVMT